VLKIDMTLVVVLVAFGWQCFVETSVITDRYADQSERQFRELLYLASCSSKLTLHYNILDLCKDSDIENSLVCAVHLTNWQESDLRNSCEQLLSGADHVFRSEIFPWMAFVSKSERGHGNWVSTER
jgi:hypothetical protein